MKKEEIFFVKEIYFMAMISFFVLIGCTKKDNYINDLEKFKLTSPSNNSIDLLPDNIVLEWDELPSGYINLPYSKLTISMIPKYEVSVWEKETNELILHDTVNDKFVSIKNLKGSKSYQWKVVVWANNETISESETWEFKTQPKTYRGDVQLSTQSEVDIFKKNEYTRIIGNFDIAYSSADPIKDLSSLSIINKITGNLKINNTNLTTLSFFTNLDSIGGNLEIKDNSALTEVLGFNNLEFIGGYLFIYRNKELINLKEFTKLKTIRSNLTISENSNLISIYNFNELDSINWGLTIESNNLLETVYGFGNLKYIRGEFYFYGNNSLTSIKGFENLNLIADKKYNISKRLEIRGNAKLSEIPNFDNLKSIGGRFEIVGNNNLPSFDGFENLTSVAGGFSIHDNDLLTSIPSFNNLESVGLDFTIGWNDELTSIAGFEKLITIGGMLNIESNNKLTSISGLNQLFSINNNFIIDNNRVLTTIVAFNNLHQIGYNIWIYLNFELSSFCFLKPLVVTGNFQGYNVFGNKINPIKDEIKVLVCN